MEDGVIVLIIQNLVPMLLVMIYMEMCRGFLFCTETSIMKFLEILLFIYNYNLSYSCISQD